MLYRAGMPFPRSGAGGFAVERVVKGTKMAFQADRSHTPETRERAIALAHAIELRLVDEAGLFLSVRVEGTVATLEGLVESYEQLEAALDIVGGVDGIERVENAIEVEEFDSQSDRLPATMREATPENDREANFEAGSLVQPAYPRRRPYRARDLDATENSMVAAQEGVPYIPPSARTARSAGTDARFGTDRRDVESELEDAEEASPGGEEVDADAEDDFAARVLDELASDAATAHLALRVDARGGVIWLRGRLRTVDEAEAAEAVVRRVPGVRDVREGFTIAELSD